MTKRLLCYRPIMKVKTEIRLKIGPKKQGTHQNRMDRELLRAGRGGNKPSMRLFQPDMSVYNLNDLYRSFGSSLPSSFSP